MPNHLSGETSPYLLQHKDNPVDWYPWGKEALERARSEDKPIFLSIGYSACHWCHVMAHESFEDEKTAQVLNSHFISIKVDREERPDIDSIYMQAVQTIAGGGGWPLSVFLLPDGRPFYGGTYFPKTARHGMPSFGQVLTQIASVFNENRAGIEQNAAHLAATIQHLLLLDSQHNPPFNGEILEVAFQKIASQFDSVYGGFGTQPKFPPAMTIELLLRIGKRFGWGHALHIATYTLDRMMSGGIYDQIGGGFHRYATDQRWVVPHFEKMLYDNALLVQAYLHAIQITRNVAYKNVVEETLAYVRREMTGEHGAFYTSQDADSNGHEGAYFVWSKDELVEILKDNPYRDAVLEYWGTSGQPNFQDKNILWAPEPIDEVAQQFKLTNSELQTALTEARVQLLRQRSKRPAPGVDTKVLTSWNGLMIRSLAQASRILARQEYLDMAEKAANFVLNHMFRDGRLQRSFKDGIAKYDAYLEDYAFMAEALIELYRSDFREDWLDIAAHLCTAMIEQFWDAQFGFFDSAIQHETPVSRPQELTDNAIPSGSASACAVLLRLARLLDRPDWNGIAMQLLDRLAPAIREYPSAFSYWASQLDFATSDPHEVVIVGAPMAQETRLLLKVVDERYLPNVIVALRQDTSPNAEDQTIFKGKVMIDGKPTAYVCSNYVCKMPVTEPDDLRDALEAFVL